MRFWTTILLLTAPLLLMGASDTLVFSDAGSRMDIGKYISILEDKQDNLSPLEVMHSTNFKASDKLVPNLGFSSSAFWLKINVKNACNADHLLLMLEQPIMDEASIYSFLKEGGIKTEKTGEFQAFPKRKYQVADYLFRLDLGPGLASTYLLKIKSTEQIQVPLVLGSESSIFQYLSGKYILSGLYFGIMLVMFLYNLFIYFSVKDKSYLYYVVYIILILLTQTSLQGFTFQFLWPGSSWMAIHNGFLLPSMVGIASLAFQRVFLQTKDLAPPRLFKFIYLFYLMYAVSMALAICDIYAPSYALMEITAMLVSVYMLYVGYVILKKGYRPAKFFLIAWSVFLVGVCLYILKDFDILPFNNFTRYSMQTGSAFEVVLISFGLADRINILKKEKESSQAQALSAMKENERIIKEQNVILEFKVKERTSELQVANTELNSTNTNLREAQSQLVESEKMASLGQLTAGIAHEINNPINFVKSNIKSLKRTMDEVKLVLDKYGEISPGIVPDEKLKEIQDLAKKLDLEYSLREINELVKGIDDGASRTAEIVKGLRNFSRLGEDDLKYCDLYDGLDSTLVLLNTQFKGKIKIIKNYTPIPLVECYPGKINQVFMNVLNNAIQAIEAKGGDGVITITSTECEKLVCIAICDDGIGIPNEVMGKIFDPFFTTKSVGQGMGLGLSIAYNIMEQHHGKISVESELGKGTCFKISLPKTVHSL